MHPVDDVTEKRKESDGLTADWQLHNNGIAN
jgi:hypothetical protein